MEADVEAIRQAYGRIGRDDATVTSQVVDIGEGRVNVVYEITEKLPKIENFNLVSPMDTAATSISLNIAEGAIVQGDAEQVKFRGNAIRLLREVVAYVHHGKLRNYRSDA